MENTMNNMLKFQQAIVDNWQKMLDYGKGQASGSDYLNPFINFQNYLDMAKTQQDYMKKLQTYFNNFKPLNVENPKEYSDFFRKNIYETFCRIVDSTDFYKGLYEIWDNINKNILSPKKEEFKVKINDFLADYEDKYLNNFMNIIPDKFKNIFMAPYEYFKILNSNFQKFQLPWLEGYSVLVDDFFRTMLKDPKEAAILIKDFKKIYDETYGQFADSPAIGQARVYIEQNNMVLDSMTDMLANIAEYISSILGVAKVNSRKAFLDYVEILEKGEEPKTFKEFYEYWVKKVEGAIEKYYSTDEFSRLLASTTDSYMKFKIKQDEAIEKYLETTPIVTKSEVDNVYKNVYDLKKEVKALKKEIDTLRLEAEKEDKKKK